MEAYVQNAHQLKKLHTLALVAGKQDSPGPVHIIF